MSTTDFEKQLKDRLEQLRKTHENLLANVHAVAGAISEVENSLKMLKAEETSKPEVKQPQEQQKLAVR